MSEQAVKSPGNVPEGKNVRAGPRGGLYYDDKEMGTSSQSGKPIPGVEGDTSLERPENPPTFSIVGPGVEVYVFPDKSGLKFRFGGPYGKLFVDDLKEHLKENSVGKAVRLTCEDYNASYKSDK